MMEKRGKIGLIGWIRVWRGRCPHCGGHLKPEIATDQSYTRAVPFRGRPIRLSFPYRELFNVGSRFSCAEYTHNHGDQY